MSHPTAGPSRKRPHDILEPIPRQISPLPRRLRSHRSTHHAPSPIQEDKSDSTTDEEQDTYQIDDESDSSDDEEDSENDPEPQSTQDKKGGKARATPRVKKRPQPQLAALDQDQLDQLTADAGRISVNNYQLISESWTDRYIDQLLAHRKEVVNTRPPSDVYAEAEGHQAQYRRTKKILSLVGHCSPMSMDAALSVDFFFN